MRSIRRQEVEGRVLRAIRERLLGRELLEEFYRVFTNELIALRREHRARIAGGRREISAIERRQKAILNFVIAGFGDVEIWNREVQELNTWKDDLEASLTDPAVAALHPHMADVPAQG